MYVEGVGRSQERGVKNSWEFVSRGVGITGGHRSCFREEKTGGKEKRHGDMKRRESEDTFVLFFRF